MIDKTEGMDSRTIVYIESERVYSIFYMDNGEKVYVRKPLNDLERILESEGIIRIHRSYMVNVQWITKMEKENVNVEWCVNGEKTEKRIIPIAQRRRKM
ncbi:MAG: LytTR family transcriptional regulator [Lachnospiraceae bacterium]|nr:LytTR family transcriptional regulator [Lachnospiraceae bacterium]